MKASDAFYRYTAGRLADYLYQELKLHPGRGDYRIASVTSGPRVLTLNLLINPSHAHRVIGMAQQLSMAAGLDGEQIIRAARGNRGTLALEIPKPRDMWYDVPVQALPRRRGLRAPVGIDVGHRPALVDFADPLTPHLLSAGTTGSGKTNVARLLVYDLAGQNEPEDVRLLLIDTKKRGMAWRPFAALPHLRHPIITDDGTALQALAWAVAEVDRRAVDGRSRPAIFLAIDEAQALLDRPEFQQPVDDLAATGREFGIHLLLAMQDPTAAQMGSASIKRNLSTRMVGKTTDSVAAAVAAGIKESGAERLTGPGDQLFISPAGIRRVTAALVTVDDLARLPAGEAIDHLDLEEYQDVEHVREQAGSAARAARAAPLEPAHVGHALVHRVGITRLARELGIGSGRARRVRDFADGLLSALEGLGHTIIPASQDIPPGSVTD